MENRKGKTIFPLTRRRPVGLRRRQPPQVIGEKDLSTQRVGGPEAPPQHIVNPAVTRKTRFLITYSGAALTTNLTPALLLASDKSEYSTADVRYTSLHINKVEAWFGIINEPTTGPYPSLTVTDHVTGTSFIDYPNGGVDWAHVAMRPCLMSRSREFPAADATIIASVAAPAAAGGSGNFIIDVTFTGQ